MTGGMAEMDALDGHRRWAGEKCIWASGVALALPASTLAHSPIFTGGNHSPATAHEIVDPAKSWVIYAGLDQPGIAGYYRFTMSAGERVQLSLITPTSPSQSGFLPSFALLVPGRQSEGSVPEFVEVPAGYGALVVTGSDPGQATYEAISPGWYYEVGELTTDATTEGTYYVVVFDPTSRSGNYGLAVGYVESFTPLEIVSVPYNQQMVYAWEGQSPIVALLPMALVLVVGWLALYWRHRRGMAPKGLSQWLAAGAALAFLGSAAITGSQMVLALGVTGDNVEALLTVGFATLSIALALVTLRYALGERPTLNLKNRVVLIAVGLVALFGWSGLYLGPTLAVLAALVPSRVAD